MIKIIKHGSRPRCTCKHCGCIFEYDQEDTTTRYIGCNEIATYIQCPECEGVNNV